MALTDKTILPGRTDDPLSKFNSIGNPFYGNDTYATTQLRMDPYVSGYSFVWVKSVPSWFQQDQDLKYFKSYIQKNLTGFQGISDMSLETGTRQTGFSGNEVNYITKSSRGNNTFTMTLREYSGSPCMKLFRKYESYIRDFDTGIALYPKEFGVEYGEYNHSCEILYVNLRPDVTSTNSDNVEFAVLYTHCVPTNLPLSEFNYTIGDMDSTQTRDIEFSGQPIFGPAVEKYARKIVQQYIVNTEDEAEGNLFLSTLTQPGDPDTEKLTSGIYKDIYNPEN